MLDIFTTGRAGEQSNTVVLTSLAIVYDLQLYKTLDDNFNSISKLGYIHDAFLLITTLLIDANQVIVFEFRIVKSTNTEVPFVHQIFPLYRYGHIADGL